MKILQESEGRCQKIRELLEGISTRIEELSKEQKVLAQLEKSDLEKRAMEYTLLAREQAEVQSALESLSLSSSSDDQTSASIDRLLEKTGIAQQKYEKSQQSHTLTVKLYHQQEAIVRERQRLLAEMERDPTHTVPPTSSSSLKIEMVQLEQLQAIKQSQLELLNDRLKQYEKEEQNLVSRIELLKAKFPDQRKALIDSLNTLITEKQAELDGKVASSSHWKEKKSLLEISLQTEEQALTAAIAAMQKHQLLASKFSISRRALWQEESKLKAVLPSLKEQLESLEGDLLAMASDRAIAMGLASLSRIREECGVDNGCVLGPLYQLIRIADPVYDVAVETIAGPQLFHLVVTDDHTASRLVQTFTAQRAGRITTIPLNRLRFRNDEGTDLMEPSGSSYIRLRDLITGLDPRLDPLLSNIFGRVIVVEKLDDDQIPTSMASFTRITLDGDRRDRRGALTGGYIDHRRSPLAVARQLTSLREERVDPIEESLESIRSELERIDKELAVNSSTLSQLEAHHQRSRLQIERIKAELSSISNHLDLDAEQLAIEALQAEIAALCSRLEFLTTNFTENSSTGDTLHDRQEIAKLEEELLGLRVGSSERQALSAQAEQLRQELQLRIGNRLALISREELPMAVAAEEASMVATATQEAAKNQASRLLKEAESMLNAMESELNSSRIQMEQLKEEWENLSATLNAHTSEQMQHAAASTRLTSQKSTLSLRLAEVDKRIRELGHIPASNLEEFRTISTSILRERLRSATKAASVSDQRSLVAYRRSVQELEKILNERTILLERERELGSSAEAIQAFIASLDCQKDGVVLRTFDSLAAAFSEIFSKIVPGGSASLRLTRQFISADEGTANKENVIPRRTVAAGKPVGTMQSGETPMAQWAGIAVEASFVAGAALLPTALLSGGQKSIIACALIFAIQRCDPAPFYIFDEIDANLDAPHRAAVAALIAQEQIGAQFLVTTFRPELVAPADRFFGVSLSGRISRIGQIDRDTALGFVAG